METKPEFQVGDEISVMFQDKWQTAKLLELGRKWAQVKFSHRKRNSKVPVGSLRAIKRPDSYQKPVTKAPVQATPVSSQARYGNPAELHMDHFDMFYRIRDGSKPIATVVSYYKEEAMVMFEAVKKFREMLTEPVTSVVPAIVPVTNPMPTPMTQIAKTTFIEKPSPKLHVPSPPAPPVPAVVKTPPAAPPKNQEEASPKKRGRPRKEETTSSAVHSKKKELVF